MASYRPLGDVAAEIEDICEAWEGLPGPNIALTGAEPFGHPDLPAIVSTAREAGCRRVCLDTDAVALRTTQNAGGSLMAGVRHVRWSLLGGTPGVHDALIGDPGALAASVEGVRSFLAIAGAEDVPVSVSAIVPVCRHNAHDLPAAAGIAVDAGADGVLLRIEDGGMDLASALPWVVAACDTGVVNGVWVEVEGVPFCLLPGLRSASLRRDQAEAGGQDSRLRRMRARPRVRGRARELERRPTRAARASTLRGSPDRVRAPRTRNEA